MVALCGVVQERPRRFARFGRAIAFIGAAILLLAVSACYYQDIDKASFSEWEVAEVMSKEEQKIIFYDIGTPLSGAIVPGVFVYVGSIHAKVLPSLVPGTAVVSGNFSGSRKGHWSAHDRIIIGKLQEATLLVSSREEADAWNRYFAELAAVGEMKMREKWSPKKIKPPPTLQKND